MEIIEQNGFKPIGKHKKKHQIILTHTSRNLKEYLSSLKFRFNGKFQRIPHYVIDRDGNVYQLLSNNEYSKYLPKEDVNKFSIIICLENLGWLEKEPLNNQYVNWIGDIYKGNVFEKKWRDYFFWDSYTEKQLISTANLCKNLFVEMKIKNDIIGHNTKIKGIEKFLFK